MARGGAFPLFFLFVICFSFVRANELVYADSLASSYGDWSWGGSANFADSSNKKNGTHSMSFAYSNGALYLHRATTFLPSDYPQLTFWFNVGSTTKSIYVNLVAANWTVNVGNSVLLASFASTPINTWVSVTIPFASGFGISDPSHTLISGFDFSCSNSGTVYFDDMYLVSPPFQAAVTISVNAGNILRPINTDIYGANFASQSQIQNVGYTCNRKGGNSETRYNYLQDVTAAGNDWVFLSAGNDVANVSALPYGSTSDQFLSSSLGGGAKPVIQLTTIGYIAGPSRDKKCSFSVAKYGPQTGNECTVSDYASWCEADCGNGIRPDGSYMTGNDPLATAFVANQTWQLNYIAHLKSVGAVTNFLLDNEPDIWDGTHRDVHPLPATYDELWNKIQTYGGAVKAAYPTSKLFAPVVSGWCGYWFSSADGGCQYGSDYTAHGSMNFSAWLMQNINLYYTAHNIKLVDYYDIHYYPAADGVFGSDDDATTAGLRLRSVKSLYDPLYQDESWIGVDIGPNYINLIPRFKRMLATYAPWLLFSITEYNFGDDSLVSSALAHAEVLAVFAREGVDLATRFEAPASGSVVEDAYKLLMNYDGTKTKYSGNAVNATSSNVNMVPAYAAQSGNTLWVLVFNKDSANSYTPTVSLSGVTLASNVGKIYRLGQSWRLSSGGTMTASSNSFSFSIPPYSAYLFVFTTTTGTTATTAASSTTSSTSTTTTTTSASTTTSTTTSTSTSTSSTTAKPTTTSATTTTTTSSTTTQPTTIATTSTSTSTTTKPTTTSTSTSTTATPTTATSTATSSTSTSTTATPTTTTSSSTTTATSTSTTTSSTPITLVNNGGTNEYWHAITVEGGSESTVLAEFMQPGSDWEDMTLAYWGDWEYSNSQLLVLPYSIRLTSTSGQVLTLYDVIQSQTPNVVFPTYTDYADTPIVLVNNEGSNLWWFAIEVQNGNEQTTNVEVLVGGTWVGMDLTYYGQWEFSNQQQLVWPMSIRLTSASGRVLTLGNILTSYTPNAIFPTNTDYTSSPITLSTNSGTNVWWFGVAVDGGSETPSLVEIYQQGGWTAMSLTWYGEWEYSNGNQLVWPISLRLTASSTNRVLTLPNVILSADPTGVYSNNPDYPISGSVYFGPQP